MVVVLLFQMDLHHITCLYHISVILLVYWLYHKPQEKLSCTPDGLAFCHTACGQTSGGILPWFCMSLHTTFENWNWKTEIIYRTQFSYSSSLPTITCPITLGTPEENIVQNFNSADIRHSNNLFVNELGHFYKHQSQHMIIAV
jgi:hypothetical protein